MRRPAKLSATYEDILGLPENVTGELIGGELYVHPRPASHHALAASSLGGELIGPFQKARGGGPGDCWILDEPELHFGKDVLVPDLAGWRRERMPSPGKVPYFTLAPDWICEVLSPSTAGIDRVKKLAIYGREGVHHVWLLDPEGMTLEVLRREGDQWVLAQTFAGASRVRAEPFEAIELPLDALWVPEAPET